MRITVDQPLTEAHLDRSAISFARVSRRREPLRSRGAGATVRRGYFDVNAISRVLSDHGSRRRNAEVLIWSLVMHKLWWRSVLD
jgi:hypothetical protein